MKKSVYLLLLSVVYSTTALAQLKDVLYKDGKKELNGFSQVPDGDRKFKPGILLLPAWYGADLHVKSVAQKLAGLGYYTFIADIYGAEDTPTSAAEAGKMSGYYKKNFTEYQKRIKLGLEQLLKSGADPNNIVVVGYCFGGTGALEAARGELAVKGVVSFHGGLAKDSLRENKPLAAKILVLHGAEDPHVPAKEVADFHKEMRESKADWQMVYYSDAVHSFTNSYAGTDASTGNAFNEKAAKRSWNAMLQFLREILK